MLAERAELVARLSLDDNFTPKLNAAVGSLNRNTATAATGMRSVGVQAGIGAAGGAAAFGLLDRAMGSVVGLIGDATRAFQEDQASVARLGAALKANIVGWNGNTAAIEAVILSRMRLGFTDEDQRNSLGTLLAATGSVSEALDVQRVAMDLARFKQIDLISATDALTKVEDGSYRILKSLGIELEVGATQQEALAAVMRVTKGAAEALANTEAGVLTFAQIRVNESTEKMGKSFSRLQSNILPGVADIVEKLAGDFDRLATSTFNELDAISKFGYQVGTTIGGLLTGHPYPTGGILGPPAPTPTPDITLNATVNVDVTARSVATASATTTFAGSPTYVTDVWGPWH